MKKLFWTIVLIATMIALSSCDLKKPEPIKGNFFPGQSMTVEMDNGVTVKVSNQGDLIENGSVLLVIDGITHYLDESSPILTVGTCVFTFTGKDTDEVSVDCGP